MNILKTLSVTTATLAVSLAGALSGTSYAAGSASLGLSPAGGSYSVGSTLPVTISENSGTDSVNVVEADLTFSPNLQLAGISCNSSVFGINAPESNGITCGTTGSVTGGQVVAVANFKVVSAGSANIGFASSSHIYRSTDNADVWNGSPSTVGYSLAAAPAPVARTTTPKATPTAPVVAADQTATKTAATKPTTKVAKTIAKPQIVQTKSAGHTVSAWLYAPVALLDVLAGVAYLFRKDLKPYTELLNKRWKVVNKQIRESALAKSLF